MYVAPFSSPKPDSRPNIGLTDLPGPGVDLAMVDPADRLWPSFLTVLDRMIRLASVAAAGTRPA